MKRKLIILFVIIILAVLVKVFSSNNFYILYKYKMLIPKTDNVKVVDRSRGIDYISFEIWDYNSTTIKKIKNKKCFKKIENEKTVLKVKNIYEEKISSVFFSDEILKENFYKDKLIKTNNYYCYKNISTDYIFMIADISNNKVYVFMVG